MGVLGSYMRQSRVLVQRVIDLLYEGNVDVFVTLFSANAEMILPNAYCVGRDAIQTAVVGLYQNYDDISIELDTVISESNTIFVQWRWCDRKKSTGEQHETDTALVLNMEEGLIKRWREYHSPVLK